MKKIIRTALAGAAIVTGYAETKTEEAIPNASGSSLLLTVSPDATGDTLSLTQARNEIRRLNAQNQYPAGGIVVALSAGTYRLNNPLSFGPNDSGQPDAPVIYRASPESEVILSGGTAITELNAVTDQATLLRFPPEAREHVRVFELSSSGDIPGFTSGGAGFKGRKEYPYELYQDGQRLPLARWPNDGFAKTGEVLGEFLPYHGRPDILTSYSGVFHFGGNDEQLERWAEEPDLWFFGKWYHYWADQRFKLKEIDLEAGTIALLDPETHRYGFNENRDYYAFNAYSELDRPGEWVLDREERKIYIWPLEDPQKAPIYVARIRNLINANHAKNVRFERMTFQNTTSDAIVLRGCEDITIIGSTIRQTGGWAVKIDGGFRCQVISCDMYHLGEGGVFANGGIKKTLIPSEHLVENCRIHDIGQVITTYRPGVKFAGTGGIARHNLIYNSSHSGLEFDGNDHLFEYNVVHDIALHASDTGAIYACTRDWSKRGTVIRYNLIHALGKGLDGAGCRAYYLDDHTSGVTIHGNIATMANVGIHIGGGKDNIVTNNLVLNCDTSIDMASRGIDSFSAGSASMGEQNSVYILTKNSPWQTELWRERYPGIADIFEMEDAVEAHNAFNNTITNNIMAGGSDIRIQNARFVVPRSVIEENAVVDGDPGLVDRENLDFNLNDSAAIEAAGDFEPIPFDDMGLYDDAWRPTPAVKYGPNVTPLPEIRTLADFEGARNSAFIARTPKEKLHINGLRDHQEWTGRLDHMARCETKIGEHYSDNLAFSQIAYDGDSFVIFASIDYDPENPLIMEGAWGQRDGFEIALSDPRVHDSPIFLVHCYPDGTFEVIPAGSTTERQAKALQESMTYAVTLSEGNWSAEMRLPLAALDISTAELAKLNYNMNVRRMADSSWMVWSRPNGSFWEVDTGGIIKMPSFAVQ